MLDFNDLTRTGISILTSAADYSLEVVESTEFELALSHGHEFLPFLVLLRLLVSDHGVAGDVASIPPNGHVVVTHSPAHVVILPWRGTKKISYFWVVLLVHFA